MEISFTSELWLYPGQGAWCFVTLPVHDGSIIRQITDGNRSSFGSVRVSARIGESTWQTSVFPDKKSGSYVLPVKKAIRAIEHLQIGDSPHVFLRIDTY